MADRRVKLKSRSLERGRSAPLIVVSSGEEGKSSSKKDSFVSGLVTGHEFRKRSYYRPTYCHHCSEMLWGLTNQGYQCTVCNYVTHEKCIPLIMTDCLHLKANKIVNHVPHNWAGPGNKEKKKWCNICRKKINGPMYYCSVCRIYSHGQCRDEAFNDCKRSAIYSKIPNAKFSHHWIEGNLPSSAKCEVCTKSCSTDLCLTGYKCGWCGINVHSSCLDAFIINPRNERCTFRDTRFMMLPPLCVLAPVSDVELGEEVDTTDDIADDMFSSQSIDDHTLGGLDEDSKGRPVLVIDGSGGMSGYKKWRKRTLHPVYIQKSMSTDDLLKISLRKFGISDDSIGFSLSEMIDTSTGEERMINADEFPYNLQQRYNGPLKLYIRRSSNINARQRLRIYNSYLTSTKSYVECEVDDRTTFADVIVKSIQLFELEEKNSSKYCIYEKTAGMCEQIVVPSDKPWKRVQDLTEDSLRLYSSVRYYLCPIQETVVSIFVWKVSPEHLKSSEVALSFMKNLVNDVTYEITSLFPSHGSLIVTVGSTQDAQKLMFSYKFTKLIPEIHTEHIQVNQEPLLVFVNTKSGGKQGIKLINGFKRHLNPYQVYDLLNGGPIPGLYSFRNLEKYRILVAGGDGTVGWVLGALDDIKKSLKQPQPPCAIVPLGTGNDLARALKWGGGYTGEKVMQLLHAIEDADTVKFDRWAVDICDPLDGLVDSGLSQTRRIIMNNYFGVGLDAEIALDFHQAREENPEKFSSRFHNKGVYLQLGVQKTFSRDGSTDLSTQLSIEVDDSDISLPSGLKGIVILNIASWGAGSEPWGNHSDQFQKCCYNDEKIEVMGLSGPVHLGQIKSGLRNGIRIAQGKTIKIQLSTSLPVQIDGEAWNQTPVIFNISKLDDCTLMLVKSNQEHYSRGLSQGQAKSLVSKQTIIGQSEAQFSSRRPRVLNSPLSQPTMGTSTHTLYIKDKRTESEINKHD